MYYAVFYVCGRVTVVCTVCEAEIKSREYTTELTLSQKNAVISDRIDAAAENQLC